jgi:tetratricopeptide (TPR) repeat protein
MKTLYKITLLFAFVLLLSDFTFAQTERENGIQLYEQGEYEKAVVSLQKAVEADEKNRDAWLHLGMTFIKLKKESKARNAFQKAYKLSFEEPAGNNKKVNIISKPRPPYTDVARMYQTQGTIKLAIEFGADGKVKSIFVFQNLPHGLTENAIDAARRIRFEPALKDGKAVTTIGILNYVFTVY